MDLKKELLNKLEEETIYEDAYGKKEVTQVIEEVFKEYESEQLLLHDVVLRSELLLAVICEYNKINTYAEIKKVEEWLKKWDSK